MASLATAPTCDQPKGGERRCDVRLSSRLGSLGTDAQNRLPRGSPSATPSGPPSPTAATTSSHPPSHKSTPNNASTRHTHLPALSLPAPIRPHPLDRQSQRALRSRATTLAPPDAVAVASADTTVHPRCRHPAKGTVGQGCTTHELAGRGGDGGDPRLTKLRALPSPPASCNATPPSPRPPLPPPSSQVIDARPASHHSHGDAVHG